MHQLLFAKCRYRTGKVPNFIRYCTIFRTLLFFFRSRKDCLAGTCILPGLQIHIHYIRTRIWIQHFQKSCIRILRRKTPHFAKNM
jgi:hypothetical protein